MSRSLIRSTPVQPEGADYYDAITTRVDSLGKPVEAKLPTFQLTMMEYVEATTTFTVSDFTKSPWDGSGQSIASIPSGASVRMTGANFEFNLALANPNAVGSNNTVLTTSLTWFRKIDVKTTNSVVLASLYPDTQIAWMLVFFNQGNYWTKFSAYNINTTQNATLAAPTPGFLPGILPPIYMPVSSTWLQTSLGLWWSGSQADLDFEFFPANSIIANSAGNGANTTVTLKSLRLVIKTQNLIDQDLMLEKSDAMMYAQLQNYLDPNVVNVGFNEDITAGSEFALDISQIRGRIAFLFFIIRSSGGNDNLNNGYFSSILSIGDRGTVDIKNSSGHSLMTNNSPWLGKYMNTEIISDHCSNDLVRKLPGYYFIPFGESMSKQYLGQGKGFYWQGPSVQNELVIKPDIAVNQIDTVTKTNAAAYTGGYMRFFCRWCGDISPPVKFDANVAALATALQEMPWFIANSITATFSAPFTTSAQTLTITYNSPRTNGLNRYAVEILADNLTTASGQDVPMIRMTTEGRAGLPAGTTKCDVSVVGMVFKELMYNKGEFSTSTIPEPMPLDIKEAMALIRKRTIKIA